MLNPYAAERIARHRMEEDRAFAARMGLVRQAEAAQVSHLERLRSWLRGIRLALGAGVPGVETGRARRRDLQGSQPDLVVR